MKPVILESPAESEAKKKRIKLLKDIGFGLVFAAVVIVWLIAD